MDNGWERNYFSISSLQYYNSCNRAYYLKYIEGISANTRPDYFQFGGAVHDALAVWAMTKDLKKSSKEFERSFKKDIGKVTLFDPVKKYLDAGRTILYLWSKQGYSFKPKLVEQTYLIQIKHPKTGEELPLPLMVKMDMIDERGIIADYKVVKTRLKEIEGFQKVTYWMAYEQMFGKPPSQFMICPIIKNKTMPAIQKPLNAKVTMQDKIEFFEYAKAALQGIANKEFKSTHSRERPCSFAPLICK